MQILIDSLYISNYKGIYILLYYLFDRFSNNNTYIYKLVS